MGNTRTSTVVDGLTYPLTKMNFVVTVSDCNGTLAFTEITGVDATVEVMEYRMGNASRVAMNKVPGFVRHGNVTMKYGLATGTDIRKWIIEQISEFRGKPDQRDITIELLDIVNNDTPKKVVDDTTSLKGVTWTLKDAFIVAYRGSDLNARNPEVAIETIDIAYEELEIKKESM